MGESNTHWRGNWQNQRPTRKATYRLKVADATEGAEWGHRRQERHSRREQRKKKKKTEKESERGKTEQDTNDHMKRTSQEEKESDCATQKATVLCLSPPSQQSNTQILSEFEKGNQTLHDTSCCHLCFIYWIFIVIWSISFCCSVFWAEFEIRGLRQWEQSKAWLLHLVFWSWGTVWKKKKEVKKTHR